MNKLLILISFFFVSPALGQRIHEINISGVLCFSDLGQAKISNEKYTLLTYTNLTHIKNQVNLAYEQYHNSLHLVVELVLNIYLQIVVINYIF